MGYNNPQNRNKRLALALSGAMDAVLGAALTLFGLGFLPLQPLEWGMPPVYFVVIGIVMFAAGLGYGIYNFSRLDE